MRIFGIVNYFSLQLKNRVFILWNLKSSVIWISSCLFGVLIPSGTSCRARSSSNVWLKIRGVWILILLESRRRQKELFVWWLILWNKYWSSFKWALFGSVLVLLLIKFFDFNSCWFSPHLSWILDIQLFKSLCNLLKVLVLTWKRVDGLRCVVRHWHLPEHGLWGINLLFNLYWRI